MTFEEEIYKYMPVIKTWGVSLILFAIVFCLGVAMIMSRPTTFYETADKTSITSVNQPGISITGMRELGKMWVEYPNYFAIGGWICITGASGMGFSVYNIFKGQDRIDAEA